jgi:hypothetical protein
MGLIAIGQSGQPPTTDDTAVAIGDFAYANARATATGYGTNTNSRYGFHALVSSGPPTTDQTRQTGEVLLVADTQGTAPVRMLYPYHADGANDTNMQSINILWGTGVLLTNIRLVGIKAGGVSGLVQSAVLFSKQNDVAEAPGTTSITTLGLPADLSIQPDVLNNCLNIEVTAPDAELWHWTFAATLTEVAIS